MLEKDKNTYVTIAEADSIVANKFALDSIAAYWDGLSDQEKEAFLTESALEIESLPVAGIKLYFTQPLQFPRRSLFYKGWETPQEVKDAQVVNAVEIMGLRLGINTSERGNILTSLRAENMLKRWTSGGFKMGGLLIWSK